MAKCHTINPETMAEITKTSSGEARGTKARNKKISTKIDMTPMVDLAFLLLTFFMLANTLSKPMAMEIVMPEDETTDAPLINEKNILCLTLGENNRIYYSDGSGLNQKETNFSAKGIRTLLANSIKNNPKLYVLIKPTDKAKYHNLVDIFDEMEVLDIGRYALVDPTPAEVNHIKSEKK